MPIVLQPIVNELNAVLVQLRTELRGLQTDADGAGISYYNQDYTRSAYIHTVWMDSCQVSSRSLKLLVIGKLSREVKI